MHFLMIDFPAIFKNMQKIHLLFVLALGLLILGGYRFCTRPDPLRTRKHYRSVELQEVRMPKKKEQAAVKVDQLREQIDLSRSNSRYKSLMAELDQIFLRVEQDQQKCSEKLASLISSNEYVDVDSDFWKKDLDAQIEKIESIAEGLMSPNLAAGHEIMREIVQGDFAFDPTQFFVNVGKLQVCRDEKSFVFLSNLIRAVSQYNPSLLPQVKLLYLKAAINLIQKDTFNDGKNMALTLFSLAYEDDLLEEEDIEFNRLRDELSRVELTARESVHSENTRDRNVTYLRDYFQQSSILKEDVRLFLTNYLDARR